jgi:hypothetical protein
MSQTDPSQSLEEFTYLSWKGVSPWIARLKLCNLFQTSYPYIYGEVVNWAEEDADTFVLV